MQPQSKPRRGGCGGARPRRAPARSRGWSAALSAALALTVLSCSGDDTARSRAAVAPRIACGSAPAEALTRMALGDAVPVTRPVPEDADPAHWVPTREGVAAMRDARLVVLAGAGLEAWVTGASLPPSRTLDAARGSDARWIQLPVTRHTHGNGEEHTHSGNDPHVWLDPDLLELQLAHIADGAARAFPDAKGALEAERTVWQQGVADLRAQLARVAAALEAQVGSRPLLAAWPCYGYLARALGVEVQNAAFDPWAAPDAVATDAGLRKLEQAAASSAGVLLWPTPPPADLARRIESQLGVTSVHFDAWLRPADNAPPLARLKDSLARLEAALARQAR
ncbi:MAG: metal ABC transporter substrate-binding protein [Planctomycetota bacterium]